MHQVNHECTWYSYYVPLSFYANGFHYIGTYCFRLWVQIMMFIQLFPLSFYYMSHNYQL